MKRIASKWRAWSRCATCMTRIPGAWSCSACRVSNDALRVTRSSTRVSASCTTFAPSAVKKCEPSSLTADQFSVSFDRDAFVDAAGVAAIIRATNGNFRLLQRLFQQIERVLELNDLLSVTPEVVTAARESLVIGAN